VNRIVLPLAAGVLCWAMAAGAADTTPSAPLPPGCVGSVPLGRVKLSVSCPWKGVPLPISDVSMVPPGARLIWDPVHLSPHLAQKGEVAALVISQTHGDLIVMPASKAGERAEWDLPRGASVVALVLGPEGLNMTKVRKLIAGDDDLLPQLAAYAQQTSQVESLVQALANSEQQGSGTEAALKGFASAWGVPMPKLDSTASSGRQAATLLGAVLPSASAYDPLAPTPLQVQQTTGLAAAVAGLFFGNTVGLASGSLALLTNLKSGLFPDTEFRSAFAQTSGTDSMAFCAKNQAAKARTRFAYLWAFKVPELATPSLALDGASYLPLGAKSTLKLKPGEGSTVKELSRAKDWRLVPAGDAAKPGAKPPAAIPVPVTVGTAADTLQLDLTKAKAAAGDYALTATWDWDTLTMGALHLRPFADFGHAQIPPAARDKLVEGSGLVTVPLTGADFEFVDKAELQSARKGAAARPAPFDLPKGARLGEQTSMTVDIDTGAPGAYKLLLAQADGTPHILPVAVLPPNPKLSNLPVRVNLGESEQAVCLEGAGIDRIESVATEAGKLAGAVEDGAWRGKLLLKDGARAGEKFALSIHVKGLDAPLTVAEAIVVEGARPKIISARKSLLDDSGLEIRDGELPAGMNVGFIISVERLQDADGDARARLELNCRGGDLRKALALAPDEPAKGATLSLAGAGSLYLALDPGLVGYRGCELTATVVAGSRGASNAFVLGHVVRLPALEKFTLTGESLGNNQYAGMLQGRDLDLIEKAGWDAQNGVSVVGIPAPVSPAGQTLRLALPWPAPAPHAPLYIWLSGEPAGRRTKLTE
jgi:hypothetical protein